ncbi:MAG: EamA family transporter [Chloroflexi bacterium HGW-Chloroflexi-10]|nr:MAG: EamA family transporter [Chloroflexi bacterium HGW-Chloroflexi-10]
MKPIQFGALLLLGAIWGASFLFIGIAVSEFGPLALMFVRVLLAGMILLVVAYLTQRQNSIRKTLQLRENWRKYLIVGLFNSALPFTLIAFAELKLTVSLAAILNSTTTLFTVLIATAWSNEKLTRRKLLGVLMGVIGVSVLMGGGPLAINTGVIIAAVASLMAACSYGAATVYASKNFTGLPPMYASMVQLLSAAILLAIPAALTIPPILPSSKAIIALLALILISTAFAYLLYFYLLQNVGPTRTASVTFLVPVFGSLWGILFQGEVFNVGMLLGMAIIFTSIGLVLGIRIGKPKGKRSLKVSKGL